MNLNELLINRGRGRGMNNRRNGNNVFGVNKMGPPLTTPVKKNESTSSPSDLIWGKSHISVTPSTVDKTSSRISSDEDCRVIIALTAGRGEARCEVGLAAINVTKPLLILCQISDTQSYINTLTKINIFNPHEILIPTTFIESFTGNRLVDKVKQHFPHIKYTGVARRTFNKINGMDVLSNLCIPSLNAILLVLQHRYYALAAASALITYLQESLFVYYAGGSVKIDYQESEGYAIIDVSTADRLELVCSAKPKQGNKYSCLFGILNRCMTKIGARTLRSSILQPPCKIEYLEERLNCITELIKHPEMLLSIQALLQKVSNIDLLLSISTIVPEDPQRCSNRQLNYILLLNSLFDLITPLKEVLAKSTQPFFVQLRKTLGSDDFNTIKNIVRETIQDDAHPAKGQAAVMQRCFAIKPGINGLLDLVRKTYAERIDDMLEYVKSLAEKYDLALTLNNNQKKGYHIVLNLNQKQKRYMKKSDLPEEFIQVYRLVGSFTMKTPELVNFSTRLDDIMNDILKISNVMVHAIIIEIKKYVTLFYKLCEEIAHLDMLQSLAETSVSNRYIRPKFGNYTEVTFARHPLLDFLLPREPISNPICCSSDFNVHIITGPNGSGKSIFIRQVLLLQVMAQVGCYVPAQTAVFRPSDRMFARIYLEDNMEYGASSFVLEMKEIKYIMTTMTENSVIIIDELCRSTSVEEGTALAIATVEKMAQSAAFVYITTHFTLLTKLHDMYLNVRVWQMETIPTGEDPKTFKLDYKYNLIPGVTSVKRYGVYIVRNIWPKFILDYVDEVLEEISKKPTPPSKFASLDPRFRLKYNLESHLRQLKSQKKLTIAEINKLLNQYHNDLQKLGCPSNPSLLPNSFTENMPQIRHSLFDNFTHDYSEEDVQSVYARMKQVFTPEPSIASEVSVDLDAQGAEERMKEMFTPEGSQQSHVSNNPLQYVPHTTYFEEDVQSVYTRMKQVFTPEPSIASELSVDLEAQWAEDRMKSMFTPEGSQQGSMQYAPHTTHNLENADALSVTSSYRNISQFIGENSENIHKLIPEVYVEELSADKTNTFEEPKETQTSSIDFSKDMNDYQFSLPLVNNFSKTSTPVPRQQDSTKSSSPVVKIYNNRRNFSTSSNTQSKDLKPTAEASRSLTLADLESLQEDLEVCSRISWEETPFEDENSSSTVYKSLPSNDKISMVNHVEKKVEDSRRINHQHIFPVVRIINGPNNTTLSIEETQEEPVKKINIISDVTVTASGQIKPKEDDFKKHGAQYSSEEIVDSINNLQVRTDAPKVTECEENSSFPNTAIKNIEDRKNCGQEFNIWRRISSTSSTCSGDYETPLDDSFRSMTVKEKNTESEVKKVEEYAGMDIEEAVQEETGKSIEDNPKSSLSANQDKTTSISMASKLRRLDQVTSDSSQQEESRPETSNKTITSISLASKNRKLDQISSDSTPSKTKTTDSTSSLKESDKSGAEKKKSVTKKRVGTKRKFVPPRKLSAKEIREEFREQDRKILEGDQTSPNFSKYLERLIKRPSVKQIQNITHVALIRKTTDGLEVIPAEPARKRKKSSPIRKHPSHGSLDLSIFSDKNAKPFECYLNSNEKDYKTFSYNFNKNQEQGQKVEFQPNGQSLGEYTRNSVTKHFVRTGSDNICSQRSVNKTLVRTGSNQSQFTHLCASQLTVNQTLTPDGYYKQNKEDINRILNKYLRSGTQESVQRSGAVTAIKSIFATDDFGDIDLNL